MRIAFLTPGFVTEEKISGGMVNCLHLDQKITYGLEIKDNKHQLC